MEFEELKKIWDTQNNQPMYAINEAALHKRIQSKMHRATRLSNINDIGLTMIALVTAAISLFLSKPISVWDWIISAELVIIAAYILAGRIKRKKQEARFDRSMLGDLDHAINNFRYEERRGKTMVWWFIVPLAIPVLINMAQKNSSWQQWLLIAGAFVLSYFVIRHDYTHHHIPQKRKLEALRKQLLEEDAVLPG